MRVARSHLAALLVAACLGLSSGLALPDSGALVLRKQNSSIVIIAADVKLTHDRSIPASAKGTVVLNAADPDFLPRGLEVYADTVTILPPSAGADGLLSTAGQTGVPGQNGGAGRPIKIVARTLICGAASMNCTLDASGGDGLDWVRQGQPKQTAKAPYCTASPAVGAPGQNATSGGAAGSITLAVGNLQGNFKLKAAGGAGGAGMAGGDGPDGMPGATAPEVTCSSGVECSHATGHDSTYHFPVVYYHWYPQPGGNGGRGCDGGGNGVNGAGGAGGAVNVSLLNAPPPAPLRSGAEVGGGKGGAQPLFGLAGAAGRAGYPTCEKWTALLASFDHGSSAWSPSIGCAASWRPTDGDACNPGAWGQPGAAGASGSALPPGANGAGGATSFVKARRFLGVVRAEQLEASMRKADMMYLTGTAESLQTVSDILQWVLNVGCTAGDARCAGAQQAAAIMAWKLKQGVTYFGLPQNNAPVSSLAITAQYVCNSLLPTLDLLEKEAKAYLQEDQALEKRKAALGNAIARYTEAAEAMQDNSADLQSRIAELTGQLNNMAAERSDAVATLKTYNQAFTTAVSRAPPALQQTMQLSGPLNTLDNFIGAMQSAVTSFNSHVAQRESTLRVGGIGGLVSYGLNYVQSISNAGAASASAAGLLAPELFYQVPAGRLVAAGSAESAAGAAGHGDVQLASLWDDIVSAGKSVVGAVVNGARTVAGIVGNAGEQVFKTVTGVLTGRMPIGNALGGLVDTGMATLQQLGSNVVSTIGGVFSGVSSAFGSAGPTKQNAYRIWATPQQQQALVDPYKSDLGVGGDWPAALERFAAQNELYNNQQLKLQGLMVQKLEADRGLQRLKAQADAAQAALAGEGDPTDPALVSLADTLYKDVQFRAVRGLFTLAQAAEYATLRPTGLNVTEDDLGSFTSYARLRAKLEANIVSNLFDSLEYHPAPQQNILHDVMTVRQADLPGKLTGSRGAFFTISPCLPWFRMLTNVKVTEVFAALEGARLRSGKPCVAPACQTVATLQFKHHGNAVVYDSQLRPHSFIHSQRICNYAYQLRQRAPSRAPRDVTTHGRFDTIWPVDTRNMCGLINVSPQSRMFIAVSPFATWSVRADPAANPDIDFSGVTGIRISLLVSSEASEKSFDALCAPARGALAALQTYPVNSFPTSHPTLLPYRASETGWLTKLNWACNPARPAAAACISMTNTSLANFALSATGLLAVPTSGNYTLYLRTSGPARLTIDGRVARGLTITDATSKVVRSKTATLALLKGRRRVLVQAPCPVGLQFMQRSGFYVLQLQWKPVAAKNFSPMVLIPAV